MKISTIILWIMSLVLAFAAGFLFQFTNFDKTANIENGGKVQLQITAVDTQPNESGKDHPPAKISESPRVTKADIVANVKQLLESGQGFSDIASIAEAYSLVSKLSEQEVLESLNALRYDLSLPNGMLSFKVLISRYAEIDASKAINYIESNISSGQAKTMATSSALAIWSKTDPTSAYNWLLEDGSHNKDRGLMSSIGFIPVFKGLANQNFDDAFVKLSELSIVGNDVSMAIMGIAQTLGTKEEFISFYHKSKEIGNKSSRLSIVRNWVNKDPVEAADWIDSMEQTSENSKLRNTVLSTWMNSEPDKAADWYLAGASEKNRQSFVDKVMANWSFSSPTSALSWINQQSDIDTQKSTKKLLEKSAFSNREFTIDNLYLLENDEDKKAVSYNIYYSLLQESESKATSFLDSSPFKEHLIKMTAKRKSKKQ